MFRFSFLIFSTIASFAISTNLGRIMTTLSVVASIVTIWMFMTDTSATKGDLKEAVETVIAEVQRQNPGFDPATVEAFRSSLGALAKSGDARKQKALQEYLEGDANLALSDLEELAEDQARAATVQAREMAATWKEIGALSMPVDTGRALAAYTKAVQVTPDDPEARVRLGQLFVRVGQLAEAETQYRHILDNVKNFEPWQITDALNNLGNILQIRGDLGQAEGYFQRALSLAEEGGDKPGIADSLASLGLIEKTRGNFDVAENYHQRALLIDEELNNKAGMASQYGILGIIEQDRNNFDQAIDYQKRSLAINQELGILDGIAGDYINLGVVENLRGNINLAEDYFKRSLEINEELGDKQSTAIALGNLGDVERARGNLDAAETYYTRSVKMGKEIGAIEGIAYGFSDLGIIEEMRGNPNKAQEYYLSSLTLFDEIGSADNKAYILRELGYLSGKLDELESVCTYWLKARDIFVEIKFHENASDMQNRLTEVGCTVAE